MPFGAALGYIVGGAVEERLGWRSAFFVAGGPGILLALLCLLIREPARVLATEKIDLRRSAALLWRVLLYRRGVIGYCAQTFAIGGFAYWAPKFLVLRFAIPLKEADFKFGAVTLVAGLIGTVVGGLWSDRWLRRMKPNDPDDHTATTINLRVCAIASAAAAPLSALCFLAPSADAFFVLAFACELFLFLSTSPINAVILRSVPNAMRASAMALSIFAIHALGDLWSPPLLGLLLDFLPAVVAMMCLPVAIALSAYAWWRPVEVGPVAEAA
jgi:predicted MFS family arabinose efflux permease